MFSRSDADRLRASLPPIDFNPVAISNGIDRGLLQAYCNHYGLSFAKELSVSHTLGKLDSGEFQIVCHYYSIPLANQTGTVFLLHGYFDHAGIFGHLIEHCLRQGLAVVIFDLPGHGLSSGVPASINSFQQYADAFFAVLQEAERQQLNQPWHVIAQSTGGAVIIDSLLTRQLADRFSFEHLILLAPLLRPWAWTKGKLLFAFTRWFIRASRRTFAVNSHDEEFLSFLKNSDELQSKNLPRDWVQALIAYEKRFDRAGQSKQVLRIIQGTGDSTVDWQYNLPQLLAKFPASQTYMISDARHHLVNESKDFRQKIFSAIDQIIAKSI